MSSKVNEEFFSHGQNLQGKIDTNYKGMRREFECFMKKHYIPWKEKNIKLIGVEKGHVAKRAKWFEKYLNNIDLLNSKKPPKGQKKNWITPQSKFRPSAIEEFVYYLLKDIDLISKLGLKFSNKKVFTGLTISPKGNIETKDKDIDLALVAEKKVSLGSHEKLIRVPAIAIEVKTYLDKTMLNETQFTAQLIKRGNPSCHVYIVSETNAVKIEELPSESPVDEIFILRKNSDAEIDTKVVYDFVCEIKKSLIEIQMPITKHPPGRLLHPRS